MSPQIRHLRYFVAVAEEQSFTQAAKRLHVAQQAVSATVRQLELELGVTLLRRSTRKVELTPSGQVLLDQGRVALDALNLAWKSAQASAGQPATTAVAYDPVLGYGFIREAHSAVRERAPDMQVSWRPRYNIDLAKEVLAGKFDAGIAFVPELLDGLQYEIIGRQRLAVIMGRSHRLAQRQEVLLTDLSREAIVCFPRELSPRFFDEITRIHQTPEIGARLLETQDPTGAASFTLYASAEAVSVALAPAAAEYVNRYPGALALVPLEAAVPQVPISVVTRQGTDTPELRALAEACRYVAENAADGAD